MHVIPAGVKRIMIVGCGGAGKSVFARRLADILDSPVLHLDAFYWKPGWIEPAPDEWKEVIRRLVAGDSWIMDGNYGGDDGSEDRASRGRDLHGFLSDGVFVGNLRAKAGLCGTFSSGYGVGMPGETRYKLRQVCLELPEDQKAGNIDPAA